MILKDLPPVARSGAERIAGTRPIAAPVLFVLGRILRPLLARVSVTGVENLPTSGAYHHQPESPELSRSVPAVHGAAVSRLQEPVLRRRRRVLRNAADALVRARSPISLPVDPDSNLIPAMQAGAFGLTHGKILVLFPEGERSIDGTVKKFKKGAPILAQHLGVPIVPVAIKGVYELWPRGRGINWRLVWPWSGHRIQIVIGKPMTFAERRRLQRHGDRDCAIASTEMWDGI